MSDENEETSCRWNDRWKLIVNEGQKFWKADEEKLIDVVQYCQQSKEVELGSRSRRVLIPFSGDCVFAVHLYNMAPPAQHRIDCIEISPLAIESLKRKFAAGNAVPLDAWTVNEAGTLHKSNCGRVCILQHSLLDEQWANDGDNNNNDDDVRRYDFVYDKDAFGAVSPEFRDAYAKAVGSRCTDDAQILFEVKEKSVDRDSGPPFHIECATLEQAFGGNNSLGFVSVAHIDNPPLYTLSRDDWTQHFYLFARKNNTH